MIRTDERYTTAITADNLKMDTREHASIGDLSGLRLAPRKWTREELVAIRDTYKKKLKELKA